MNHRTPILSFLCLFLALAGCLRLEAGSLLPYPLLAKVETVHLGAPGGDLSWDPIPGLDRRALDQKINRKAREALSRIGLRVAEPEDAYFSVTIEHAWNGPSRDTVALLVEVKLSVLAQPLDASNRHLVPGRPTLSLWEARQLRLGPAADAEEIILNELEYALERFVEERAQAQELFN